MCIKCAKMDSVDVQCKNTSKLPQIIHTIRLTLIRSFSLSKPHAVVMPRRVVAQVHSFNKRNMSIFEKFINHFRRYTLAVHERNSLFDHPRMRRSKFTNNESITVNKSIITEFFLDVQTTNMSF